MKIKEWLFPLLFVSVFIIAGTIFEVATSNKNELIEIQQQRIDFLKESISKRDSIIDFLEQVKITKYTIIEKDTLPTNNR